MLACSFSHCVSGEASASPSSCTMVCQFKPEAIPATARSGELVVSLDRLPTLGSEPDDRRFDNNEVPELMVFDIFCYFLLSINRRFPRLSVPFYRQISDG